MKETLEEYNEGTTWEIRESSVVRDGYVKIASATAAMIEWNGTVKIIQSTTEIMVGVFGNEDTLDQFAVWNAKDDMSAKARRETIMVFLHQGPVKEVK